MRRREMLKSTLVLGGAVALGRLAPEALGQGGGGQDRVPRKGEEWNESFLFPDEATTRPTRRLTSRRTFNHKPTYHINQGFSPDNRYLVFCTYHPGGESALVRAEVESGDLKVIDHAAAGAPFQFNAGNSIAMIPRTELVAYSYGGEVRVYDIHTMEMRVIFRPEPGKSYRYSHPAGTADGKTLIVARNDRAYDRTDASIDPNSVLGVSFFTIDLASGRATEVFRDATHRSDHVIPNPVDPALAIIDLDAPPRFSSPNCAADIPRNSVLDLRSGKAIPIRPANGCNFTWHTNWNFRGDHVYYHGPSALPQPRWLVERYGEGYAGPYKGKQGAAHFIGVATVDGRTAWEHEFPVVYYGHSSSHATRDVIILDNVLTQDLLIGLHWRELDSRGVPRLEVLGRHNSDYANGQQTHPHSQMSTDGRWLSYNSGHAGRSDVYLLDMA